MSTDIMNSIDAKTRLADRAKRHWTLNVAPISAYLKQRRQLKINRDAFNNMLSLNDEILKDIGVTRNDVRWASRLPLSQNAGLELDKIAKVNRLMGG